MKGSRFSLGAFGRSLFSFMNLLEASCRIAKVSLLILLPKIGVPVVGVLKTVSMSTLGG